MVLPSTPARTTRSTANPALYAPGAMMKGMVKDWIDHYGRPAGPHTDPEGCFRETSFREWLREQKVEWQPSPAGAHFRMGIVEKMVDKCRQHVIVAKTKEEVRYVIVAQAKEVDEAGFVIIA